MTIEGRLACVGELHFDLSDDGKSFYEKAKTAVHYRTQFPGSDRVYVGLSVNAGGDTEDRVMTIDGQDMNVHYVMGFTETRSCDIVTLPGARGQFVTLMEDVFGAHHTKEAEMKVKESLSGVKPP